MNYIKLITLPENIIWAWRKVQHLYKSNEGVFNQLEIALFDLDLEKNIESIRNDFLKGQYTLQPIKLLPQLKKPDENGKVRMRQYFEISIRDQVAWMAITNALGPIIDEQMPPWSYGNRLYKSVWYEEEGHHSILRRGPYRHTAGYTYRKFKHGWPLFRSHVFLTAKCMTKGIKKEELNDYNIKMLLEGKNLPYLKSNYWPTDKNKNIYYASIDLKQFYPNISMNSVIEGFKKFLPNYEQDLLLQSQLKNMSEFYIDTDGLSKEVLQAVSPECLETKFTSIPTGLWAAGFLSNVAMLSTDKKVSKEISRKRRIAHFRYVDDHSILAYDFDELCQWIKEYEKILIDNKISTDQKPINRDKCDPIDIKFLIWRDEYPEKQITSSEEEKIKLECFVDGANPAKLMTQTLAQVSELGFTNFDVLTEHEKKHRLEQLEWLLLANIPDREIKSDTRASFAAGKIARIAPRMHIQNDELIKAYRNLQSSKYQLKDSNNDPSIKDNVEKYKQEYYILDRENDTSKKSHIKKYFFLLLQALKDHPEKTRLFSRLLSYMQITGYNGFSEIKSFLLELELKGFECHTEYLKALSLQTLGIQILSSTKICVSQNKLYAEIEASKTHLENISNLDIKYFFSFKKSENNFHKDAKIFFAVSLYAAAKTLNQEKKYNALRKKVEKLALSILPFNRLESSYEWYTQTKYFLGVWLHLLENYISIDGEPSIFWISHINSLEPSNNLDWSALRRYPEIIPEKALYFLRYNKQTCLSDDDDGWLLDLIDNNRNYKTIFLDSHHEEPFLRLSYSYEGFITLSEWIKYTQKLNYDHFDPRTGEWTALEIVRQILSSMFIFPNKLSALDHLHPNNILIPQIWKDLDYSLKDCEVLSWERWKEHVYSEEKKGSKIIIVPENYRISDYRMKPNILNSDNFDNRLRGLGQLLWFILRHDTALPKIWNIRGQERSTLDYVSQDLEKLPASSYTLSLLKSCLEPRSQETKLINKHPDLFAWGHDTDPDTQFDPKVLRSFEELLSEINSIQKELENYQITVLYHAPRQLIPVNLKNLGPVAAEKSISEIDNG